MSANCSADRHVARRFAIAVALVVTSACSGSDSGAPTNQSAVVAPPPAPSPPTGQTPAAPTSFSDKTSASGLVFTIGYADNTVNRDIPNIYPSGVAAGDYDNDGDIDLFVLRGNLGPNLLFRNRGDFTFEERASAAGVAFTKNASESYLHGTPAFADMDGDDDLDLLLTGLESNPTKIYVNNGDGTFSDVSTGSGLEALSSVHTHSPAFGDYDLDGDLDLLISHWGSARDFNAPGDTEHLWRNDTDASGIKFTSVSVSAGLSPNIVTSPDPNIPQRTFDYTFSPTFVRVDDDEYPDILFVADFNDSQYFKNNGDGTFSQETDFSVIIDGNGMGSTVSDYDGDGDMDWFVSSILATGPSDGTVLSEIGNRLYRNDAGVFVDVTVAAGVDDGGWGWGSCFIDFDNDGNLDIYHTNGWPFHAQRGGFPTDESRAFISNGDGTFTENAAGLGIDDMEQGRGIVCADFDGDGDVDIVQLTANTGRTANVWENETNGAANYLTVKLQGLAPNTDAVGARVSITAGGASQTRDVILGSNFSSHNPTELYYGLGNAARVDSLSVRWPDGKETMLSMVDVNQRLVITHPDR